MGDLTDGKTRQLTPPSFGKDVKLGAGGLGATCIVGLLAEMRLYRWLKGNKLSLNVAKTRSMLINHEAKEVSHGCEPSLTTVYS